MKRLYRVTATYADGQTWRRDYQSASAAKERRARLLDGIAYGEQSYDHINGFSEPPGFIPKAVSVTIERSDPVTWPNDEDAT